MFKKSVVALVAALLAMAAGTASADVVCADSSYCTVTFTRTYTGNFNPGQPYDYVTVAPDGSGETFAQFGITIRVFLKNCQGQPLVGVPAQQINLFNANLCICPGGAISDAGTDANGMATFSGTLKAGGCVPSVDVYADGVFICTLRGPSPALVTVKLNSTDAANQGTSPCFTDSSDLAAFAARIGKPAQYNICFDYNETGGPTIDSSDLAFFASVIGAACN
jgi:type 1 fimbria pilin